MSFQAPSPTLAHVARASWLYAKREGNKIVAGSVKPLATLCPVNALSADAGDALAAWFSELHVAAEAVPSQGQASPASHAVPHAIIIRTGWNSTTDQPLWLPTPKATWQDFAQRVESLCTARQFTPVVTPRATDVISDTPGLLGIVRTNPRWKVLFDPSALMTPSMAPQWKDHAQRYGQVLDALLSMHALWGVVLPDGAQGLPQGSLDATLHAAHDAEAARVVVIEANTTSN